VIIRKRIIEVEDKAIPVHLILGLDNKIGNFFITY